MMIFNLMGALPLHPSTVFLSRCFIMTDCQA